MSWQRVVVIALCLAVIAFVSYFAQDALSAVISFLVGITAGVTGRRTMPLIEESEEDSE
jgi:hypothetical protein